MDRITQNRRVLGYLRVHKTITPIVALKRLGVMRLGARIWELKRDGHPITSAITKGRKSTMPNIRSLAKLSWWIKHQWHLMHWRLTAVKWAILDWISGR
jgi:hypothetical protein